MSQKTSSVATTLTPSASTKRGSATALCIAGKSHRVGNDYQIRCPTSNHPPPIPHRGPGVETPGELSALSFAGKGPAGGMTRSRPARGSQQNGTQFRPVFPPFGRGFLCTSRFAPGPQQNAAQQRSLRLRGGPAPSGLRRTHFQPEIPSNL